jgi:phage regulator Rha-like protein
MNNVIALIEKKQEARVSSLVLSEHLGNTHKAVLQLIDNNKEAFKKLGQLPFEMGVNSKKGAGQTTRFALLNEDQSYLLLAFSRNTERVKELKLNLIQAFSRFRRERQNAVDYLPFYHELHDSIKALAEYAQANGSKKEAYHFHMNYNKLINRVCGIESGQRQNLGVNIRVNITNVTAMVITTIKRGIAAGTDYHDIYQQAKVNVESICYLGNQLGSRSFRAVPNALNGFNDVKRKHLGG